MSHDLILVKVDRARALLAEASNAQEAKMVADMAKAAEVYARRQKLGEESIRYATAIMTDAMTLLGEFLKTGPKASAGRPGRISSEMEPISKPQTQEELLGPGGRKVASDAQALADLKAAAPELHEAVRNGQMSVPQARSEKKRQERKAESQTQAAAAETIPAIGDRWRIERGDCLDFLKRQPPGSIDLVFGSPPYEDARLYLEDGKNLGAARDTTAWVAWMVEVTQASLLACKGLVAFVVAGRTKDYAWSASPALLMAELIHAGITLRCPPIYRRVGIPGSGGPDWLRNDYEWIVCATNGGPLPWADNTAMGKAPKFEPGGDPSHRTQNGSRVNSDGFATMEDRNNQGPHRARQQAGRVYQPPEVANPGNVIDCVVGGGSMGSKLCHENEAPFPESLAEFFIRSFCPPGGIVCDPFAGSGTTLAVAVAQGRVATGCDLRDSQVRIVKRRLNGITPPLFAEGISNGQQ